MATRNAIVFYLNAERIALSGSAVFQTLSDYLRYERALTGTKIVCSEGDCGACTVIVGWPNEEGRLVYRIIDSCIQFLFQLDCCHVITVEGIGSSEKLHPAQQAMVTHFGSQCGFCTPGFVMAMAHLADFDRDNNSQHIRQKLAGNLCRCTGYEAIVTAAKALLAEEAPRMTERFATAALEQEFAALREQPVELAFGSGRFFKPANLEHALSYLAQHNQTRLVAGATDLGVQRNKGKLDLRDAMFIAHLPELCTLQIAGDCLHIGAAVNWTDLLRLSRQKLPELASILGVFAAEQIRNAATIGGNIMNASPIADSLPCLFALDAELLLGSASGRRTVPIRDFYQGYKKMDIRPDEMLVQVRLKLPKAGTVLRLYKVSKRRDLDISTITVGAYLELENGIVRLARLAAGGMGPTVMRLVKTESAITGREPDQALSAEIEAIALTEVTPISDVRGSADFRRLLLRNLLRRFFDELKAREVLPA